MNSKSKILAAVGIAATLTLTASVADARSGRRAAVGFGVAAGALLGAAAAANAAQPRYYYDDGGPVYYYGSPYPSSYYDSYNSYDGPVPGYAPRQRYYRSKADNPENIGRGG